MTQELSLKTQIELDETYYGSSDAVSSDEPPIQDVWHFDVKMSNEELNSLSSILMCLNGLSLSSLYDKDIENLHFLFQKAFDICQSSKLG